MERLSKILSTNPRHHVPTSNGERVVFYLKILPLEEMGRLKISTEKGTAGKKMDPFKRVVFFERSLKLFKLLFPRVKFIKVRCTTAILDIHGVEFAPEEKKKRGRKKSNLTTIKFTDGEFGYMLRDPQVHYLLKTKLKK